MRKLTFLGFVKDYAHTLSEKNSYSMNLLAEEARTNSLLRAPLFLWALLDDDIPTLLAKTDGSLFAEYSKLKDTFTKEAFLDCLERNDHALPEAYHVIWRSYVCLRDRNLVDEEMKERARQQILEKLKQVNISAYRISKDLNLDAGNVGSWLNHDDSKRISNRNAERILEYLCALSEPKEN